MTSTPKPGPSPDELHAELDTLLDLALAGAGELASIQAETLAGAAEERA